jgi:hypothetical protein
MRCLPSSIFIFLYFFTTQFDWPITPKKKKNQNKKDKKLWRLPKIEGFFLKYRVPLLWPSYIGERRTKICHHTWDKSEVLWINCWGTHWELEGNIVGTHCELGENEKNSFPPETLKGKSKAPWVHAWAFQLAGMRFVFPKEFIAIFGLC